MRRSALVILALILLSLLTLAVASQTGRRWLSTILILGTCSDQAPQYGRGDVVYHRLNGTKMVITRSPSAWTNQRWEARYSDKYGKMHEGQFNQSEFTNTPTKKSLPKQSPLLTHPNSAQ